jgi:hypothetical protein
MADTKSGPYASVKNRRSRAPNKRPYDSFAEGESNLKIHNTQSPSSTEVQNLPTEESLVMNLQRVENERRDLLRSIITKLKREALEGLLVDAGLEHKAVMTKVIAANTIPRNWRDEMKAAATTTPQQAQPQTSEPAPISAGSGLAASFLAKYQNYDLVTPPTERKYTTPYPPLKPIPTPADIIVPIITSPKSKKTTNAKGTPKSARTTRTPLPRSAGGGPTPKSAKSAKSTNSVRKVGRPLSKKFPVGRGPGRYARGTIKEAVGTPKQEQVVLKTSSGRAIKRTKYTEPDTEEEEEEEDDDNDDEEEEDPEHELQLEGEDTEMEIGDDETVAEEEEDVLDAPTTNGNTPSEPLSETFKNGKPKKTRAPKNPADKNKDQTMIPVGILSGAVNVALAGFDRRMGLIFRTSRYNRDGEFVGLGDGMSRSIKRDKVDFHPVLAHLNEEDLRKEILRRQTKIGYQPPPGRSI